MLRSGLLIFLMGVAATHDRAVVAYFPQDPEDFVNKIELGHEYLRQKLETTDFVIRSEQTARSNAENQAGLTWKGKRYTSNPVDLNLFAHHGKSILMTQLSFAEIFCDDGKELSFAEVREMANDLSGDAQNADRQAQAVVLTDTYYFSIYSSPNDDLELTPQNPRVWVNTETPSWIIEDFYHASEHKKNTFNDVMSQHEGQPLGLMINIRRTSATAFFRSCLSEPDKLKFIQRDDGLVEAAFGFDSPIISKGESLSGKIVLDPNNYWAITSRDISLRNNVGEIKYSCRLEYDNSQAATRFPIRETLTSISGQNVSSSSDSLWSFEFRTPDKSDFYPESFGLPRPTWLEKRSTVLTVVFVAISVLGLSMMLRWWYITLTRKSG